MAAAKLSDEAFSAILEAHPGLRERFASIAIAVANSGENLKEADAIEERIVEEMRLLGREAMQGWAETQVEATEKEIRQQPSMHRQGKKTPLEPIAKLRSDNWDCGNSRLAMIARRVFCKPALDQGAVDAMHWQFLAAVRLCGVSSVSN